MSAGGSRARVAAALVTVQIFFAFHYAAAKYILGFIPPLPWATIRAVAAAILIVAIVLVARHRIKRPWKDIGFMAFCSIFGVVINQVCFVEGLSRTDTTHSAIINTTIPVATLLIAILAGRERATGRKLLGIGLALTGMFYLIAHSGALLPQRFFMGDLLNVGNALSYSFFLVISKPVLAKHGSLSNTAILLVSGALGIALIGGAPLARLDVSAIPQSVWWLGGAVVIFATVLAYLLNFWALKRVESSTVAMFIYMQPIIASIVGVTFLGESLGPETLVSGALIFTGLAVAMSQRRRAPGAA